MSRSPSLGVWPESARGAPGRRLRRLALAVALLVAGPRPASAQVDPSGSWRTLHTTHFRVHFRPAHRDIARRAAAEAERAWALLATELVAPRGRVDLTLADDYDGANGYASVVPSNRVTIFLAPPATELALLPYDDWLRLVLVHELAHVFHLDRARGLWSGLRTVFGRAPLLFPNGYQPNWVSEGIATYYESRFSSAGRAEGSFHSQLLGAAAAGGVAPSPWDAYEFTRWPAGATPYAWGSRFFSRTARLAGDSLVPRFVEGSAGQLIPVRVGRPLRRAGGVDLARDWQTAGVVAPGALGMDTGDVLVRGRRSAPVPRVAPGSDRLAYVDDDGRGARRLRIASLADSGGARSRRVTADVRYDWHGDTLLVSQLEFTDRRHIRTDLYRWDPDGRWRRVSRGARLTEPRAGGGATALIGYTPGGNRVVTETGIVTAAGVEWGSAVPSPDGRWIAAARHAEGRWALVRWPVSAPESVAVLFDAGAVVSDPAWAPDGSLLFVWDGSGLPRVLRYAPGGRTVVAVDDPWGARSPAALADGSVLYTTLRADGWQLRRVRPLSAPFTVAASSAAFDSAPPVATRESGYALWPSLRPRFWLPLYADAGVAGRFVGVFVGGSDAVGRFAYAASALVGTGGRVAAGLALQTDRWSNPTLDGSLTHDWSGVGRASDGTAVSVRELDAAVGATVVARWWRTQASLRVAAEYAQDRFVTDPDTAIQEVCPGCVSRDLLGGSVTLGVAHAVVAPLAISTQDGFVWSITARRRERQGSPEWADELRTRLAVYLHLPIGGFAFPVIAARVSAATANGPAAEAFGVGGVSGGVAPLVAGQALGSRRTFPVRGYAPNAVVGRRALAASFEVRVPVALVGSGVGHLPLGVDRLSAALFVDVGDAWDSGGLPDPPRLRSLGGELVADLTVPYDFPLRLRAGVAVPRAEPSSGAGGPRAYAVLGADF